MAWGARRRPGHQRAGSWPSGDRCGSSLVADGTRPRLQAATATRRRLVDQDIQHVLRECPRIIAERLRSDEAAEQALHFRARRRLDLPDAKTGPAYHLVRE